jgi:MFS transporter, DHA1 family, inner membrane transport protein
MAYFTNSAFNRVNLHSTLQALAAGLGGIFVFVFMLKAGVPTAWVLTAVSGMTAGRFFMRPAVLVLAKRFGVRNCLVLGVFGEALVYPLLPTVHGLGWPLAGVILFSALGSVFYWTSLHATIAAVGDDDHRGKQVALMSTISTLVGAAAPLLGGWALATRGPIFTFWLAALVQAAAALPLFGLPSPPVIAAAPGVWRAARPAVLLQASDGWFSGGFYYAWQIGLFQVLNEKYLGYGGAMAIAALAGSAASLLIGGRIDIGRGRRWVWIAYGICAIAILAKAVALLNPIAAVLANTLSTLAPLILSPVMMAPIYTAAKASACPLRFHMATEGGWDIGCCTACLVAAALAGLGLPMALSVLTALAAVFAGARWLLRQYNTPREIA